VGSGKSSLIGSMYRAVNGNAKFPSSVRQTLHHPEDRHGTLHWWETAGNQCETINYQDTRGDQVVSHSQTAFFLLCVGWEKGSGATSIPFDSGLSPDFGDVDWCEWATKNIINQM